MQLINILELAGAGILAGIFNAIAGGGTFFTFPILIALGLPPTIANATNAVAVWPGTLTAALGYKKEIVKSINKIPNIILITIVGSIIGTLLVRVIGNESFRKAIPLLILIATVVFAMSGKKDVPKIGAGNGVTKPQNLVLIYILGLFSAIYGGFFGAGYGIMAMAGLALMGIHDVHENNALKNLLAFIVTTISVAIFIFLGMIDWLHALPALIGSIIGSVLGVKLAKKIKPTTLRTVIIIIGLLLTVYFGYVIF